MRLLVSAGIKKYFANTSWLLFERVVRVGTALVVSALVIRHLGPNDFGVLSYALSLVALFSVLSQLGLEAILTQEIVRGDDSHYRLLGTGFVIKLFGSLVAMVAVAAATIGMKDNPLTTLLVLIIAVSLPLSAFTVIVFYFQAKVEARFSVYAYLIQLFVSSGIKLGLIWVDAPLIWFAVVVAIEALLLAVGLILSYRCQKQRVLRWRFDRALAISLLRKSWPLALSAIAIVVYSRIDQVMLKKLLDDDAVGQYAAAVRISEAWHFFPVMVATSLFPALVNAQKTDRKLYLGRLQRLHDLLAWLAIAVAVPVTLLAEPMIALLFGQQYNQSATVLQIHIWAGFFVAMGLASGRWLILENLQRYAILKTGSGALVNIALNLLLIPEYGVVGAAVATVVSCSVAFTFSHLLFKKIRFGFKMQLLALPFGLLALIRRRVQ